ncbi:DUF5675 family protein [Vibrio coralliilyticus]|uniref:DUF5675 family protein n=1 Tax=Vibrio coralliilyticus TaxID=190893 RepID=UPI001794914A|nr:DUF5675 family protein [Vibrio coralliilyticus]NUW66934.1 hypothetical protein [Vibrio coralliilyticus]
MKHYTLKRRYFEHGTFSTLHRADGSRVCCMIERPMANNIPSTSCVLPGDYKLYPHESPHAGHCYALESPSLGVTRYGPSLRTHILIHVANLPHELQGCLAPGTRFGTVNNEWGVLHSREAFYALMNELDDEIAQLTIKKD